MKKIGLIANPSKDINLEYAHELIKVLNERNCETVLYRLNSGEDSKKTENIYQTCDFIVVLGGDGTILEVARNSAFLNLPILGINLGNLGYLTDVDKSEGIEAIDRVLNGRYKLEKRMMIEAEILGKKTDKLLALNDICVLRGSVSKMICLELEVNDEYIDTYKADGIIVATPTGSTAYNLSAGGPILKPDRELIAITPICPHKMYSRSSVISAEDQVNITIGDSLEEDIILSIDGQVHLPLEYGDKVNIKRSEYYTTVIKTTGLGFYDILRKKFYH